MTFQSSLLLFHPSLVFYICLPPFYLIRGPLFPISPLRSPVPCYSLLFCSPTLLSQLWSALTFPVSAVTPGYEPISEDLGARGLWWERTWWPHSIRSCLVPCISLQSSWFHFSFHLNSVPQCLCITFTVCVHLSKDIQVVSFSLLFVNRAAVNAAEQVTVE